MVHNTLPMQTSCGGVCLYLSRALSFNFRPDSGSRSSDDPHQDTVDQDTGYYLVQPPTPSTMEWQQELGCVDSTHSPSLWLQLELSITNHQMALLMATIHDVFSSKPRTVTPKPVQVPVPENIAADLFLWNSPVLPVVHQPAPDTPVTTPVTSLETIQPVPLDVDSIILVLSRSVPAEFTPPTPVLTRECIQGL